MREIANVFLLITNYLCQGGIYLYVSASSRAKKPMENVLTYVIINGPMPLQTQLRRLLTRLLNCYLFGGNSKMGSSKNVS
jgi:hypothetical protein